MSLKERLKDKVKKVAAEQEQAQQEGPLVALSVVLERDGKHSFVLQDPDGLTKSNPFIALGMAGAAYEVTCGQFSPVLQRLAALEKAVGELGSVLAELLESDENEGISQSPEDVPAT